MASRLIHGAPRRSSERRRLQWEPIRAAVGGVIAVEVVNLLLNPPSSKQPVNWVSVVALAGVGAIIGWMYQLARAMTGLIIGSMTQLEALSRKLDHQDEALSMLLKARRHGEALSALLSDSIGKNFRNIPFVDENRYLHYLVKAIEHSDMYQGVQRNPVRWFLKEGKARYLERLRDKRMKTKIRILSLMSRTKSRCERILRIQTRCGSTGNTLVSTCGLFGL